MNLSKLTLKKKIAILMTSAVFVIGLAAWMIIYRAERSDSIEYTRAMLSRYLDFIAVSGEEKGINGIKNISGVWTALYPDGRVTVVSLMGDVVMDTKADAARMENHYTRGEVMEAFEGGEGSELRYSKTQREWQIYMAKRVIVPGSPGDAYVVRLSYPVAKLSGLIKNVTIPFIKYFTLILLLVWLGTYLVLRLILTPLNSLSLAASQIARGEKARFPITNDGEIQALSNTLNSMQDALQKTIREAQERKEELAQLVGALPIGVILIDDEKKIRYINKEAAAICGRAELPARGSSVELILPSHELYLMLDEPDASRTLSIMHGGAMAMQVEATTLELARGRLIALQDLTEKARLEEVRRDFFIDAGHEFQTPLAIIRTGLELLKSSPQMKVPERSEDVETIDSLLRQQERISGLVDDLLLLVRLDADPMQKNITDVDLAGIAEEVKDEIAALPQAKATEIAITAPADGAHVMGIHGDLRRALLNIMENAQKYIQTGDGSAGIIKVSIEEDEGKWRLTVDDNGPGIAENERELVFERFRRGDGHRARGKKKSGGYGLGLSISRRIIERHGGTLEIGESQLGGAAFVIRLPK
ncbi:sensor histidine kinase [Cloacibacillus evryensis]|uniref:sensor histidine kinase n=2 Tax=Cloacibacillus evryensis TaxID=508460 RepID=UPI00241F6FE6|nr:ATP-binding protein [Cloacibacillus evryensis]